VHLETTAGVAKGLAECQTPV